MTDPRVATIEGRQTLIVTNRTSLPRSMPDLLAQMAPYGFRVKNDITLAGARTACTVLRTHRFRTFREGRWYNPTAWAVTIGQAVDGTPQTTMVPKGLLNLVLQMCADCGAVKVIEVYQHAYEGARPHTLTNRQTGEQRTAPVVGTRELVIGWYTGKNPAGRQSM